MSFTVGLVSLGCSKNRVDSEQMLGILSQAGHTIVADPAQAEVIIVNTCGFIGPAKEESINTILEMAQYKQSGQCKLLLVTGCLAQRYGDQLDVELPEVDGFLGVNQYDHLPALLAEAQEGTRPMMTACSDTFLEAERVLTTPSYSAYIKIGDGCDNRCSYCAIPLIRGGYRSRPQESILAEVRALADRGVKEFTLIAQDTTRFGTDLPGNESRLPQLLKAVAQVPGVQWLRVLYCYPARVDHALLDTIQALPNVCPYIDLPIQHIVPRLLTAMNRHGTAAHIRDMVKAIKERGMTLRTSIIVGFPGETDEDFEALLAFVQEAQFDRLGAFAFSPEEDTPAYDMADALPEAVKQQRLDRLMALQQGISLAQNRRRVGTTVQVLVEGKRGGRYVGRSMAEAPETDGLIHFTSPQSLTPGEFVSVRILSAKAYDLIGEKA